jgi:probable rRNA maturation factor
MAFDISFFTEDNVAHPFPENEADFINWLSNVAKEENKSISTLNYIFCSDDYLLDINIKYLGHDYYTDIITFPYKEGDELESDLYISLDRVKENAHDFMVTFDNELKRVMVHGLLHLMGYGDKSSDQTKIMREKEDHYIEKFESTPESQK